MKTRELTHIALMAAVICVLAPISVPIPIGPVALTLATFALYLTAYVLPPRQAVAAVGLYLLLGAIGLPVFSGYLSGVSRFVAPGGGYLVGYLFLTGISSYFIHRDTRAVVQIGGMYLATLVTYCLGTFWMARTTGATFLATLPAGMFVFLPLDTVKILLSCWLGRRVGVYVQNGLRRA